jgi:ATP/maltotriose-dependent transcriptional regulator MalT
LFVTEVVRLLAQEQKLTQEWNAGGVAENLGIPDGVKEAIGPRLHRLSDSCNRVLSIGSVIGREFGSAQLERLVPDLSIAEVLESMEEALKARIIEELPHAVGRYQFTHVLVQETLASTLSAARQSRLHADIGEALEDMYSEDLAHHAAELAHHFARVETGGIDEKFVRYSLMAGEQALAGYAFEDALDHFQRGLARKKGKAISQESADLLFGFSRAAGATSQLRDAWAAAGQAFDYFMETGNVAAAVSVAKYPLLFTSGLPQVTHMVTRALTLVPEDSLDAGYLLSRFGLLLNLETGDYPRAQESMARALVTAQHEGDVSLEIQTLSNAADVDWYQMNGPKVLEDSLRAIDLARSIDDAQAEAWPRFLAAFVSLAAGDPAQARRHAREMLTRVESLRDRSLLVQAYLINMHVSRLVGDWESAREFCDRGLASDPRHSWLLGLRSILEYELGDSEMGETYLQRAIDVMRETVPGPNESEYQTPAWAIPMIGRITGDPSRFDLAEEAAQSVLAYPSCTLRLSSLSCAQALMPVVRHDAVDAERRYNELSPLRDSVMTGDTLTIGMATMDRVFGLLASAFGQVGQGISHLDDAISFCENAGYRPELAWSCCDCAEALIQRNASGDRQRADTLLDKATDVARELGMKPLMDRLADNVIRAGSGHGSSPDYPCGLTHREVEVLRLLAAGDSNREIAAGLVLSVRTVERHVANIYGKTDSRGRAEATAFAFTNGLTEIS